MKGRMKNRLKEAWGAVKCYLEIHRWMPDERFDGLIRKCERCGAPDRML